MHLHRLLRTGQDIVTCCLVMSCRFWHLVHSTPSTPEAFWRAITLSKERRAGYVYVTDDNMAEENPW